MVGILTTLSAHFRLYHAHKVQFTITNLCFLWVLSPWNIIWWDGLSYKLHTHARTHARTQPFYRPSWILSGTTRVSRHQKGKTRKVKLIWIYCSKRVSGSGINWAMCKSALWPRHITMTASHHSKYFTGRMPFLPPNQQHQSTKGNSSYKLIRYITLKGLLKALQVIHLNEINIWGDQVKTRYIWVSETQPALLAKLKPVFQIWKKLLRWWSYIGFTDELGLLLE